MPRAALFAIAIVLASAAHARQGATPGPAAAQEADPWLIKLALGYLSTSGNTDSSSLNTGFSVSYVAGHWLHSLEASAINSSEAETTTAEAYGVGWRSEYNVTKSDFLFGRVNWRKDRFSGYEQQLSETVGYGRRLIDRPAHVLNVEIGAGARQAELADGTMERELITRGGLSYQWTLNESAQFTQGIAVESGPDNTWLESVTALRATVAGNLALVASYTVKNNSDVPEGSANMDRFTAISLEYAF
jgi:putative salt-induced outer membrane protein